MKETELQEMKTSFSSDNKLRNALEGKQIEIDAMEQMNIQLQGTVYHIERHGIRSHGIYGGQQLSI